LSAPHGTEDHKCKAIHDKDIAELLLAEGKFPDWVITCSFYLALHAVDAYAHKLGLRNFDPTPDSQGTPHGKREYFVKINLSKYFNSYCRLRDRSEQARYDPLYFKLMPKNTPGAMLNEAKTFMAIK
jgi:hypothetical protein